MTLEENKAVARRFVEAANRGDVAALKQILADNFSAHTLAGDMNFSAEAISLFSDRVKSVPDFRSQIIDIIAEGDKVVVLGRDTDRMDNLGCVCTPRNQGRPMVDHSVPDRSCLIVFPGTGRQESSV